MNSMSQIRSLTPCDMGMLVLMIGMRVVQKRGDNAGFCRMVQISVRYAFIKKSATSLSLMMEKSDVATQALKVLGA